MNTAEHRFSSRKGAKVAKTFGTRMKADERGFVRPHAKGTEPILLRERRGDPRRAAHLGHPIGAAPQPKLRIPARPVADRLRILAAIAPGAGCGNPPEQLRIHDARGSPFKT
jgi:hypothetical protein